MPRDITPTNKAVMRAIEAEGYRVGVGEYEGVWICTAKRDHDNQLHVSKAPTEDEAVTGLAESVGIDLADG